MSNETAFADIDFRPICSNCHKEIFEVIDYEEMCEVPPPNEIVEPFKKFEIKPVVCPNCGASFKRIRMPKNKFPIDNTVENSIFSR